MKRLWLCLFASICCLLFPEPAALRAEEGRSAECFKPVGEWTGRLLLPKPDQRDPSGGVPFKVENSPIPGLVGRILWVRWDTSRPWDQWFETLRFDISINPGRLAKTMKSGIHLPVALDGWKRVSALESLAGARPGEMTVLLEHPVLDGDVLRITEEPVQICGSRVALVRFERPAGDNRYRVTHFNPTAGDFSGPAETVSIPETSFTGPDTPVARSSTIGIERSRFNADGWYAYGRHENGIFIVEALEPRALMRIQADRTVSGVGPVKDYVSHEHLADLSPGLARVTELVPGRQHAWKEGDRGLLVHLFGWRHHPKDKGGVVLGLVTGHFAFGLATVVRCPFTGEPRFDLEYLQCYAHNRVNIVSGRVKWHDYTGSLRRGWMYTIPVSDTIVRIPELEPYDFGGWVVQPWNGLRRQFEKMHAVYRTGAGSGISTVWPDVSCVQDSHCALYSALRTFEETIATSGRVKAWLNGAGSDKDEVKRYLRLLLLVRHVKKCITTFGLAQGNWREFLRNPLATRDPNAVAMVVNAALSRNSVFPRKGNDHLLHMAADIEYPMWSILACQIGGLIPELTPLAPTSPTAR
ncbi:MAG TPA: hypothetical protein PLP29_12445 [Candidatus Ozemobacteraceae bacterium]|nr:hypothetical protein [Candidatus Ozemobacteraceae bacterium]